MIQLHEAQIAHRRNVQHSCFAVQSVAGALHRVGMTALSDELLDAIAHLPETLKAVDNAVNQTISDQISHGHQMMHGIVELALNNIIVPKGPSA